MKRVTGGTSRLGGRGGDRLSRAHSGWGRAAALLVSAGVAGQAAADVMPVEPGQSAIEGSGDREVVCAVTITELGTLDNVPSWYWAHDLNDSGQVVGHRENARSTIEGFRWLNDGMERIGPAGGLTTANCINSQGQIAGTLSDNSAAHAYVWQDGKMTPLQGPCGPSGSSVPSNADDINDAGMVVGMREIGGVARAYVWDTHNRTVKDLASVSGGNSRALAINNLGQVAGWFSSSSGQPEACLWSDGQATPLGTLGTGSSWASDINDQGHVVGFTNVTQPSEREAFIWDPRTGMTGLGGQPSRANGINGAGQVVGRSQNQAFLYENGQLTLLMDLLPEDSGWILLFEAVAINDAGQIVGTGIREDGNVRAFLMSVPTACPADVTADGQVDVDDLIAVVMTWGEAGSPNDIDSSGMVDVQDLVEVLLAWGSCDG